MKKSYQLFSKQNIVFSGASSAINFDTKRSNDWFSHIISIYETTSNADKLDTACPYNKYGLRRVMDMHNMHTQKENTRKAME